MPLHSALTVVDTVLNYHHKAALFQKGFSLTSHCLTYPVSLFVKKASWHESQLTIHVSVIETICTLKGIKHGLVLQMNIISVSYKIAVLLDSLALVLRHHQNHYHSDRSYMFLQCYEETSYYYELRDHSTTPSRNNLQEKEISRVISEFVFNSVQ